jgi:hypothetical protein
MRCLIIAFFWKKRDHIPLPGISLLYDDSHGLTMAVGALGFTVYYCSLNR